jgi:hypothetical protein
VGITAPRPARRDRRSGVLKATFRTRGVRNVALRASRRLRTPIAAAVLAAAMLLTGSGIAFADDPGSATQGPITLSPDEATYVCTKRIPAILARVDRVTARINADASTRGSTAWLKAREDRAKAAGHDEVADRIQKRIDGRPAKLDRLADAKKRATDFRDAHCTA